MGKLLTQANVAAREIGAWLKALTDARAEPQDRREA
jgi:hypothetical protein